MAIASRLSREPVADARWVGYLAPDGHRLRAIRVVWEPSRAVDAEQAPEPWINLLIVDDECRLWAMIDEIGDADVWCDGVDAIVGGIRVPVTAHGFIVRGAGISYDYLTSNSYADPKGFMCDSLVVGCRAHEAEDTRAFARPSISLGDGEREMLERLFPPVEGPEDDPKERTFEVLAREDTEDGAVCVVLVHWALTAMLSPHGGSDLFWVSGDGEIVAELGNMYDEILDVQPHSIALRWLEDRVCLRDGALEGAVRHLNYRLCDGPFEVLEQDRTR